MEKRIEVRTYRITLICDECKEGEMLPTGHVVDTLPPSYTHRCKKCGARCGADREYPLIRYEPIESETRRNEQNCKTEQG